jgi:hypothetical protein
MSRYLVGMVPIWWLHFCMDFARNTISRMLRFLVDQFGHRSTLARLGLNGQVNYTDRNLIEKWVSHP